MTKQKGYRYLGLIVLLIIPSVLNAFDRMKYAWFSLVPFPAIRNDDAGSGHYGASRTGHTHNGVDILVYPGQTINSPVTGKITRIAYPYEDDLKWRGVEIQGAGDWSKYRVKIFYMEPFPGIVGKTIGRGEQIGTAQKISNKYPGQGMQDHIHVEVFENGIRIDPTSFLI